jgi:CDP-4-dehydro-6-deoxyglucose reductase
MFKINLKNNKYFQCSENETLIEGARKSGIILDHSCLSGRCSSCRVMVDSGLSEPTTAELGLSDKDKKGGYILSCVRTPKSNMEIQAEDLSEYGIGVAKIVPAKISVIEVVADDILKVILRFPPNQSLNFISGQYVNIVKGDIKRSYSIANSPNENSSLEFFIKKYPGGLLSNYWFNEAKINDLLRIEGPKGTFFIRNNADCKNIVFLATGTGIAPVKSILESMADSPEKYRNATIYVFWGVKYFKDLFWNPENLAVDIKYFPVLSREENSLSESGHVQNVLLSKNIELKESVVYACGSNDMIQEAKVKLTENGLPDDNFYSDAFVTSN